MSVTIRIQKELEAWWGSDDEFLDATDEEIIELVREDLTAFIDGAEWEVIRPSRGGLVLERVEGAAQEG